jgi:putative membrane protein insertion efficiency factor
MSASRHRPGPVRTVLLAVLRFYQRAVSPALPPRCRFYPTCSTYAVEAIERHGAARGTWLALRRLAKCAPWHPGGVDLVPEAIHRRRSGTAEVGRSSTFGASAPLPGHGTPSDRPPGRATPPATSRTPPQEAGVA